MRTRRCALPCRPTPAAAHAAQSTPEPRFGPRKITHDVLVMPDPEPGQFDPGAQFIVKSGEPRAAPPRDLVAGVTAPLAVEIRSRVPLQPEPLDPDATAQIRKYPFGMAALLKSP
jgi:hypothetical protein